ncbi:FAD-dependent monooxygenase [Nocardia yunnanensis]|nr:FAD-dependent monooxygenase [Nocardia yunnanensis]
MARIGEHAVVLGAGMGGLLAARVLSEFYSRVTVIERDELPVDGQARKGVPQGRHVHGLLPRGKDILETLFPGFEAELLAAGAVGCDALAEIRFQIAGHTLKKHSTGYRALQASRPHLERHVRRRVAAIANVTLRDLCEASALETGDDRARITGVTVTDRRARTRELLAADLVVASMGRGSVVPSWLEKLGYPRPEEEGTAIDIVYRSAFIGLPPESLSGDKSVTIGVRDLPPRALALFAVEDDRHLLTLIGHGGEEPPADPDGFLDYAAELAPPEILTAVERGELLSEVATFRYKANLRRRYDRLTDFPDGLLAVGDSLCSFSPVYGQGMTVSAIQMSILRECLTRRGDRDLARRFYRAVAPEIDNAWLLTVIADGAMPHATAHPAPHIRAAITALEPVLVAAERDTVVASTLFRIMGLTAAPTAVLRPDVLARIALANVRAATGTTLAAITSLLGIRTPHTAMSVDSPTGRKPSHDTDHTNARHHRRPDSCDGGGDRCRFRRAVRGNHVAGQEDHRFRGART